MQLHRLHIITEVTAHGGEGKKGKWEYELFKTAPTNKRNVCVTTSSVSLFAVSVQQYVQQEIITFGFSRVGVWQFETSETIAFSASFPTVSQEKTLTLRTQLIKKNQKNPQL